MQAGEEMLRTKPGKKGGFDENSYRSPDKVNSIKWEELDKEEYMHTVNYYRGLINFRKAHPSLRLSTREQVWKKVHPISIGNEHVVAFRIDEGERELFVVFNADTHDVILHLPEGKWDMHINGNTAGTDVIRTVSDQVMVAPISAMVLSRKKPIDVVAALIWEKDKFLICQRPANKTRGQLWEFVGGKVEEGETMQQALQRECAEELAVNVHVGTQFMQVIHEYPDMLIRLTLFHCTIPEGFPQALEHNDLQWIHPGQTDGYDFCPADTDILKEIKRVYGNKIPL
jgi:8-oxo-dGTP diphosphatase